MELAWRIRHPATRWEWVSSWNKRDLPTPGSPTTATTSPRPCRTPSSAAWSPLHLCIAPDEAAQAPKGGGLKPRSHLARSDHVENLDGGLETLHRHGAKGLDLHEVLGQAKGLGGDPDGVRGGELLHAGRKVSGLPNGRV